MTLIDRIIAVLEASPSPLRASEIADFVYADDPDGGPLTADSLIRNTIAREGRGRIASSVRGYVLLTTYRDPGMPIRDRFAHVLRLHRAGFDYQAIGDRLGVSEKYACRLVRQARAARSSQVAASTHAL